MVYNGDLFTAEDCHNHIRRFPETTALMLGRGLISNPALAQSLTGGEALTRESLRNFHDTLWQAYLDRGPESFALSRMHDVVRHICCCFEDCDKTAKSLHKAKNAAAYKDAAAKLFECHELRENPCFLPKG